MDLIEAALQARATNAAAHAESLATIDPTWRSETHDLAAGRLVLSGAGMYVNQALTSGVDPIFASDDLDLVVARSRALGVEPTVEVTPHTRGETTERLRARGFTHAADRDIALLIRPTARLPDDSPDFRIRPVESAADLRLWQEVCAAGFGHTTPEARRVSDAYVVAAFALDNEHMLVAYDPSDDRPVGCATMTVRDRFAVLGGMATVPDERRRGIQAAMIRHRLRRSVELRCEHAAATAAVGSASERNLRRHDFVPACVIQTYTLT